MTELILCNGCGHLHPTQSPKCMETDCLPDCPTCRAEKAEAERDDAREALARVEAVKNEQATYPGQCCDGFCLTGLHGLDASTLQSFRDVLRAALAQPATDEGAGASGPHSRACGIKRHEHGRDCHANCPTCGGTEARP